MAQEPMKISIWVDPEMVQLLLGSSSREPEYSPIQVPPPFPTLESKHWEYIQDDWEKTQDKLEVLY